jgi:hypothetical protein
MLLQTNSYIVPKDKRTEHARLIIRFKQTLARLGCDHFEAYEQVGANWSPTEATGRFVQVMRFRDRKHQQQVQAAERSDPGAQALIKEFCELINFPYQQQQGLFAVGFYASVLPDAPTPPRGEGEPPIASPQNGQHGYRIVDDTAAADDDDGAERGGDVADAADERPGDAASRSS